MDSEQQKIKQAQMTELRDRELARRALDTIRVYNPLDHVFSFMYDRYWHRIPARTMKDLDRYLAIHFFKKICDYMIGQQILAKGEELKKIREQQMGHVYLDKYEENVQVWDKVPRLNDPDLIDKIKEVVILGVVEEYGMDEPEVTPDLSDGVFDPRPLHEQIFSSMDKKVAPPMPESAMNTPIEELKRPRDDKGHYVKKPLADEITA